MSDERVHRIHLTLEDGYRFTASFPEAAVATSLALDEPPPLGHSHGPNAAALLGAAIGNCLGASLLFCLRRARVTAPRLDVDAVVHIARTDTGRFRIDRVDVTLDPQLPAEDLARLDRCEQLFQDFCIVTESVRAGIPVHVTVGQSEATPPLVTSGVG